MNPKSGEPVLHQSHSRWLNREKEHRAVIKENPCDADAWRALGHALEKQSRLEEAKNALRESIRLDPKNCRTLVCLGQLLTFSDLYEPEVAEEHLLQALEFEPDSFAPAKTLAYLFWFTEQRDKAKSYFESSLELKPYATTLELDYIYFLSEDPAHQTKAETLIRSRIESRSIAIYWRTLALVLENQGRITEALNAINTAIELQPNADSDRYTKVKQRLSTLDDREIP